MGKERKERTRREERKDRGREEGSKREMKGRKKMTRRFFADCGPFLMLSFSEAGRETKQIGAME